jgi:hypothetical protein
MGDNSFAGINFNDSESKQIFNDHEINKCSSYKEDINGFNFKVDITSNNNHYIITGKLDRPNFTEKISVMYNAANPPTYNSNFSGSGLPYPTEDIAFENTPNRGIVDVVNGDFKITIRYPNSYYINMGTLYIPPQIQLMLVDKSGNSISNIKVFKLGEGIPFRTLTWPVQRNWNKGSLFYDNQNLPVRTQYQILLDSAYPSINKTPNNFWGLVYPN